MVAFSVGELFSSFNDVQQKLSEYSEEHFCHFYIKDSKKLSAEEIVNPELQYKHIVYSCIYGGQKPRFRGSGTRSVSSIRHGCPANVYLRVTKDREHLQVRSFVETHNHELTEEGYRAAAQDKKLPLDLKAEVEELLLLGADKDRLCDYIRYVSKKNLDKKNLFNIYDAAIKQQREISKERALMLIQKVYAVETEDEADQILRQLLNTDKPTRRSRKQEVETLENFEVSYVNEGGDSSQEDIVEETVDELSVDQRIQRLMSTITSDDGEHIVIVQEGDDLQVLNAVDNPVEEYLTGDTDGEKEMSYDGASNVIIKQEGIDADEQKDETAVTPRYLTLKELSKTFQSRKRKIIKPPIVKKRIMSNSSINDNNVMFAEPVVKRIYNPSGYETEERVERDDYADLRMEKIRAEHEKLITETEMLKLKRNKIVKDISKLDVEKSKLFLEIDLIKEQKKKIGLKIMCLQHEYEAGQLLCQKINLEIDKLKIELNENCS